MLLEAIQGLLERTIFREGAYGATGLDIAANVLGGR